MINYSFFYKEKLPVDNDWGELSWDCFISAYTLDDRTLHVYDKANADKKIWLVLPEYKFEEVDYPANDCFSYESEDEAEYISSFFHQFGDVSENKRYCIDATGFLAPYLIFLLKWFKEKNFSNLDIIYSEPDHYQKRELTQFSDESVIGVRQLIGFEGNHNPDTSNDLLIINSGYDHKLISNAAEHKDHACKIQLLGFPPLRADMYQENVIRAHQAEEAVGSIIAGETTTLLAPANDPFVTANVLSQYIRKINNNGSGLTNLYLCPLGTKPQMIGMILYYLYEHDGKATSVIYPFCNSHSRQTSVGIFGIWKYTLDFSIQI